MIFATRAFSSTEDIVGDMPGFNAPMTINYVYPPYIEPPEPEIYSPDDYNDFNYISLQLNGIHQYNNIPGYKNAQWINGGVGLEYGHMWNINKSRNYLGFSLGGNYFGESTHNMSAAKGSISSYTFMFPLKARYLHKFDGGFRKWSAGVNGGGAYGIGANIPVTGHARATILYNNFLPVAGAELSYDFNSAFHVVGEYSHYFGLWNKPVYTQGSGVPSADVVSIGARYAF